MFPTKKYAKKTANKIMKYDFFSEYYTETELPMITVNSLNEIVDFNEKCSPDVGYADIGLEIEIRPLVDSKQKSFPYTAVLTLKNTEYLACVCLAKPRSDEYKHIYFSNTRCDGADALLTSRFIIEQKYMELHSNIPLTDGAPLKKLQRLMMISRTDDEKSDIPLERIVEYTAESYKKRFEKASDRTLVFQCNVSDIKTDEGITSLSVSLAALGMMLSNGEAVITVTETLDRYVFTLVLKQRRFMGDISSCGFSGMFLSRISCLNYWNTELMYNAPKDETTLKVFVPKSKTSHRFSAETRHFDAMAYAELLTDAFLM